MKREIIFRGKRINNGEWVYGYLFKTPLTDENSGATSDKGWFFLTGETRYCIANEDGCAFVVDKNTIGQFTGLYDKATEQIYEGDIVRSESGNNICRIEFGKYIGELANFPKHLSQLEVYGWLVVNQNDLTETLDSSISNGEIIGNIHDNPEMINSYSHFKGTIATEVK